MPIQLFRNGYTRLKSHIQRTNQQSLSSDSAIFLVLTTTTTLYGCIAFLNRIREGNLTLALLVATFVVLNIAAIFLVIKKKKHAVATSLSIGSIFFISASVIWFSSAIPVEFLITIMPIAACVVVIANLKFAILYTALLCIFTLGTLWLRVSTYGLDDFVVNGELIIKQATRATAFGFVLTLIAMQILRNANKRASENTLQLKEEAIKANKKLTRALESNRSFLNMTLRMQKVSKTFFFVYYVETDRFYSTLSKFDQDSPKFYTLNQATEAHRKKFNSDPILIQQIRKAVQDGKNWNESFETRGLNNQIRVLNTIGDVEKNGDKISTISGVVHDITEQRTLTNKLYKQANYDYLTGLLNRHSFEKKLEKTYKHADKNRKSVYLFLDLDRFKIVNDTSGHKAGDELLKKVSKILKANTRKSDLIARIGGDEFAILLIDCELIEAQRAAENIRSELENIRFEWSDSVHTIAASIGLVELNPELGSINDIQNLADEACYNAKNSGRNRVEIVKDGSNYAIKDCQEKRWINKLNKAFKHHGFVLFAQEIERAREGSNPINKFEILIRLYDEEENKYIPPGHFLPVAERYNLMIDIDIWVFDALEKILRTGGLAPQGSEFWINLSGDSVSDTRVADHIVRVMQSSPVPHGTINFEITETSAIKNLDVCTSMMARLREYGCRFALDDFGSGHASFGYLRKLPVDIVKIDGMFIKNIVEDNINRIFTKSIIDVAHSMGMEVTAEFVENEEIRALLKSMGADYVQGFGVNEPKELIDILLDENQHQSKTA